jgi:glutathione S-transferase
MPGYKLYFRSGSGSMVIEAALRLARVDFERVDVPDRQTQKLAEFRTISPTGKIPVLVTPLGETIVETMAMLIVLDERHPNAKLLPERGTPDRIVALQWLSFLAASTYPATLRYYYAIRFSTKKNDQTAKGIQDAASLALDADFAVLAPMFKGPLLLGKDLTITDVYAAMIADWHEPATKLPAMIALKNAVLQNEHVAAAWASHGYGDW